MDTFIKGTMLLSGLFMIIFALVMQTTNFVSSIVFKVIPFLLGIACLMSFLYLIGWLIKL